jgi:3-hydroxybutyryl-CoA dehydrogenase
MKQFEEIKKIATIGTGMIGPDVSLCAAMAGYAVTMMGRNDDSVARGRARFEKNLKYLVDNNLSDAVAGSDLVVEAIIEVLEDKQALFKSLEDLCSPETILVSSTSGLSSNDLAAGLRHRDRAMVMHFWNPPYVVPLVECVPNDGTSEQTVETCRKWLEHLDKEPVFLKKDTMGHIGNRLQHALLRECFHLIQSGVADAQNIDKVFRSCLGPRYTNIGLIEYMETVGWDLQVKVESYLLPDLAADQRPQKILMDLYKAGTWGAKTNSGLYDWANKSLDEVIARQNSLFLDRVRAWKNKQ